MITALLLNLVLLAGVGAPALAPDEAARGQSIYVYVFEAQPHLNGIDHSRIENLSKEDRALVIRWLKGHIEEGEDRCTSGSTGQQ